MKTALQVKNNTYFEKTVACASVVAEADGICNLAAIPGAAVERLEEFNEVISGDEFHETELSRNLEFAKTVFDLTMNCLDINEDVANRNIRIAQIDKMKIGLDELRRKL